MPRGRAYGVDEWARGIAKGLGSFGRASTGSGSRKSVSVPRSTGGAGRAGRGRPSAAATPQAQARRRANVKKLRGR